MRKDKKSRPKSATRDNKKPIVVPTKVLAFNT